jgi:hypothetical protein
MCCPAVLPACVPGLILSQGLDVKRHSYNSLFGGLHTDVDVTVVDYK